MKKIIIKTLCAILLMAFAMSAVACGSGSIYDDLADEGYTVRVRFDAGEDGLINDRKGVSIVEVYDSSDVVTVGGKTGIRLLSPDDPARKDSSFKLNVNKVTADGVQYFSAGWYTGRTETENGYVYSGRWDFNNNLLDPNTLEGDELTLYAAWIATFNYEFYAQKEDGSFELIGSKRKIDLKLPEWNERKEEWKMNDLPKVEGKEFVAAYLDEAMTQSVTGTIDGDVLFVDYEKGIATTTTVRVYVALADVAA